MHKTVPLSHVFIGFTQIETLFKWVVFIHNLLYKKILKKLLVYGAF